MWQDYVFMAGNFAFTLLLIPSILSKHKPHWTTSLFTSLLLYLFAYCFFTLDLMWATVAGLTSATAWMILFIQSTIAWREYVQWEDENIGY
uniref:Uncharacterized protein n=1 Tax=viral metagenome TaxID=1070528 RepID=A0A6M3L6B2_9ZZZZ